MKVTICAALFIAVLTIPVVAPLFPRTAAVPNTPQNQQDSRLRFRLGSPEVLNVGPGVTPPRLINEVKPSLAYTNQGILVEREGVVKMECVVLPEGRVGDLKITKSLEPTLDREAAHTVWKWLFEPGMVDGKPVPVQVEVEVPFALGKRR